MIAIPMMVVVAPAALALPIPFKEALSVMARRDPAGARVGRAGPVSVMPLVVVSHGIPVALHPEKFRTRTPWHNHDPLRRRRADSDPDRNLTEQRRPRHKQQGKQFCFHLSHPSSIDRARRLPKRKR